MKVLIFTRDYPPDYGGVQVTMEHLARFFGDETVVLTRRYPGDAEYDRQQPRRIRRLPRLEWRHDNPVLDRLLRGLCYLLRFLLGGIYLAEEIRRQKTDAVHCAYPLANGLPMMVVRIFTGCPYVVYCHGTEVLREIEKGGVNRLLLKFVLRLAARVVVTGEFMAGVVGRFVKREKIIIAPLGADSGELDPAAPPLTEVAGVSLNGRKVLLTVGRIERRKGQDKLAEALPEIVRAAPTTLWVVVGDGPAMPALRRRADETGLGEHVVFTGRLTYRELSGLYARADVFAMPNRQIGPDVEGFGIVFLEAARFGTPCVAGQSGGAPQAIDPGRTGLLCDGENPADIAEKIIKILSDDQLAATLGRAGREWVRRHTWDNYCRTIAEATAALARH